VWLPLGVAVTVCEVPPANVPPPLTVPSAPGEPLTVMEAIVNFCQLRDFLHAEGERIKREIFGYLQLNQVAMSSTCRYRTSTGERTRGV
jgi:hypothetical protein